MQTKKSKCTIVANPAVLKQPVAEATVTAANQALEEPFTSLFEDVWAESLIPNYEDYEIGTPLSQANASYL